MIMCRGGLAREFINEKHTAKPVTVGPQAFTLGELAFLKAFVACLTAVWMVNAGNAMDATP